MVKQKTDESIEEIDRETLVKYIETKEFLAVIFCKEQLPTDMLAIQMTNAAR